MALVFASGGQGGGSGTVQSVTAADTSIVVAGTAANPTVATGTLDKIAADHAPAADWSNNGNKIKDVASGVASTDVATVGQIPAFPLASAKASLTTGDVSWNSTTFGDISSSLDLTITTGTRRCLVGWTLVAKNSTASQQQVDVSVDGTRQGQAFGLVFAGSSVANINGNLSGSYLTDELTAGSHTFKLMFRVDGGTSTIYASTTIAAIVFWVAELPL